MRGDSVLRGAVHLTRADLDLEQLSIGSEHSRVKRLIAVRLRLRDVVLNALLQRRELVVNYAQRVVAIWNRVDEDADGQQVVDLLVRLVPFLHLLLDRPQMLGPARHFDVIDGGFLQVLFQRLLELRDGFLAVSPSRRNLLGERLVLALLEMLERQILQLPADPRHSEAVRERRVQIASLGRYALLSIRRKELQRPDIVQAVGELDEDDAGILGNREQQLAVILDLPFLRRVEGQVTDLGQAIDDFGDLLAELGLDVVNGNRGVLDNIVNQPAGDGGRIQLQIDEDLGDFDAMRDVPVSRQPLLALVGALAKPVGALQQLPVQTFREVLLQPGGKGVLFLLLYRACRQS